MNTRVVLALVAGSVLAIYADGQAENVPPPAGRPDGGASLVGVPASSAAAPASSEAEAPFPPPPRSLDSKRAPVPDRLMLPADMEDIPLAPPTPPIPNNSRTKAGSGANRTSAIFKGPPRGASDSPRPEVPGDDVTRTPEDQLAPPAYPAQGPR